ncbi:inorganic phosphate transporter [Nitratidesulfovibrio vulgaris]|uniref:Phosphate transporter family protein n=2 Tax=Nitratidesulfovibrio vulgaris TaxID=881 RepID=Q729P4_NITV2|nr:inorganic phosphate transporter [Nitratidesulfovibrio vulgaris]GEB80551.1 inorganic phosphate transporter [Desulfovibrio desulfuricans]HBW16600.1 inorganic phosphate transporter [Desulfovibrio sp.]AAS96779.1 phosphate transporter family protein [Nitratidesulfovibrio vulgaris str. Hildenborough]ABM27973.1 phosphate transporter [Nitratidesulfovibrio vulgaris DP4]ADP87281.1 phosphate transporter [Nitratidesulfovibrio vulgaris RCH1]
MLEIPLLLVVIIVVALIFDFTNGAHDCANAIATVVSTKVISPKVAVIMAAGLNLFGAFLGEEVAHTLGSGIVNTDMVMGCQALVLAALIGAIAWNLITWYFGIPSSSSHALIGGLMGAAVAYSGFGTLNGPSIAKKILLPLVLSPLAGFAVGFLFMSLLALGLWKVSRQRVSSTFHRLQILSAAFMATSHGLNDAQKTMGVITLALFIFHEIDTIHVPFWVKFICASAMAAGTALGGWKIVKTMGHRIFKLEPVHGFAAETSAALVITGASAFGAPISTTHTITACIFGVGSTKRLSAVRWGIAGNLVVAWVLTIPASALIAALSFWLLDLMGFVQ